MPRPKSAPAVSACTERASTVSIMRFARSRTATAIGKYSSSVATRFSE